MNIKVLQELQPYSLMELQAIFPVDEIELNNILKSLSLMNIMKRLSKDTSKIELEDFLELDDIENLTTQFEGNMYVFKYVGMLTIGDTCLIIYPKYVKEYKKDELNNYIVLKQLIAVIRKYQSKKQNQGLGDLKDSSNFNLLSITLDLITNYLEHGLYRNDRRIVEMNGTGEILWDKTINESTAYFSKGAPIYLDTFTIKRENNEQDYFRRLHAAIITEACNSMKDILEIIDVECINLSDEKKENFGSLEYIIYRLNQELSTQFVTYRQNVIHLIKRYILEENNRDVSEKISFVGTNSFNLVWEDVCSVAMDDCTNKSIKELGLSYKENKKQSLLLSDVISKPNWKHTQSGKTYLAKKTLIPDIVSIHGKNFSIYDAKYYKITLNERELKNQPGVGDVTKQYLYELAYKDFIKENDLIVENNAFLMPTDGNEEIRIGTVSFEIFHGMGNINFKDIEVILKPCDEMYKKYLSK